MPQASKFLRLRWKDDTTAWEQLVVNFTEHAGLIRPKAGYTPTKDDLSAIKYLCDEWDYAYQPEPCEVQEQPKNVARWCLCFPPKGMQ